MPETQMDSSVVRNYLVIEDDLTPKHLEEMTCE